MFAALAIRVNLDNETLQDKSAFGAVLLGLQFVTPALILVHFLIDKLGAKFIEFKKRRLNFEYAAKIEPEPQQWQQQQQQQLRTNEAVGGGGGVSPYSFINHTNNPYTSAAFFTNIGEHQLEEGPDRGHFNLEDKQHVLVLFSADILKGEDGMQARRTICYMMPSSNLFLLLLCVRPALLFPPFPQVPPVKVLALSYVL